MRFKNSPLATAFRDGVFAVSANDDVFSLHADDLLWADVLNLGAFHVLALFASPPEIFRAISSAWRNWREGLQEHSAAAAMHSL